MDSMTRSHRFDNTVPEVRESARRRQEGVVQMMYQVVHSPKDGSATPGSRTPSEAPPALRPLLGNVATEILESAREHQAGRVAENATTVATFEFSERWFRDSHPLRGSAAPARAVPFLPTELRR